MKLELMQIMQLYFLSLRYNTTKRDKGQEMPYVLRKQSRRGYKVCKKGTRKCFSKRALTKRMAIRQMRALYLNESPKQSGKQGGKRKQKQSGG
jgi:hypothetical protein